MIKLLIINNNMAMDPRESRHFKAKKVELDSNTDPANMFPKITSSRQWSTHKNPRIVRVSRALGGKDRHSKVFTVRGLRDRRIRLSVPTAIQLYDLQDRLGLSQPSKVVDWLIDATKEEIDKLPPLPMMPRFYQPSEPLLPNQENKTAQDYQGLGGFVAPHNFFPESNYNQSLVNHNLLQLWDHSPNLSLSQFGGGFPLSSSHIDDHHSMISHAMMIPSFPSYNINQTSVDSCNDQSRDMIISSPTRTFGLNMSYRQLNATDERRGESNKNC